MSLMQSNVDTSHDDLMKFADLLSPQLSVCI